MLLESEFVTLRQITPPTLLKWDKEVWSELRLVLPGEPICKIEEYYFSMIIVENNTPSIKVTKPTGEVYYIRFRDRDLDMKIADLLTRLVNPCNLNPAPLLKGIQTTYKAFLDLYNNLLEFQVNSNNLAKNYIIKYSK